MFAFCRAVEAMTDIFGTHEKAASGPCWRAALELDFACPPALTSLCLLLAYPEWDIVNTTSSPSRQEYMENTGGSSVCASAGLQRGGMQAADPWRKGPPPVPGLYWFLVDWNGEPFVDIGRVSVYRAKPATGEVLHAKLLAIGYCSPQLLQALRWQPVENVPAVPRGCSQDRRCRTD